MSSPRYIGVVGASEATPQELETARGVGSALAEAGAVVLCGGRGGVMEAVCEGAKRGRGLTVGVLPGVDRAEANAHVDIALATGVGELRNALLVRFSDALIAIGGGWGTLSEIGFAMRIGRPVVALTSWEALLGEVQQRVGASRTRTRGPDIRRAADPDGAVRMALSLAGGAA